MAALAKAGAKRDAPDCLQICLEKHVLLAVTINPEERVKVARGPAPALLQQAGYTPVLVKVVNQAATTKSLRVSSPQSGPVTAGRGRPEPDETAGPAKFAGRGAEGGRAQDRFLQAEMVTAQPMTSSSAGFPLEVCLSRCCTAASRDGARRRSASTWVKARRISASRASCRSSSTSVRSRPCVTPPRRTTTMARRPSHTSPSRIRSLRRPPPAAKKADRLPTCSSSGRSTAATARGAGCRPVRSA